MALMVLLPRIQFQMTIVRVYKLHLLTYVLAES